MRKLLFAICLTALAIAAAGIIVEPAHAGARCRVYPGNC